jgi:hypothetical protein
MKITSYFNDVLNNLLNKKNRTLRHSDTHTRIHPLRYSDTQTRKHPLNNKRGKYLDYKYDKNENKIPNLNSKLMKTPK